jgi:hypothetical protein
MWLRRLLNNLGLASMPAATASQDSEGAPIKTAADFESPLAHAMAVWTGWDREPTPRRDDSRVVQQFGQDTAVQLLPMLKQLSDDFYASNAKFQADNISHMARLASDDFKKKHPDVAEQIVKALAWCYTYDFK